jgi:adenylate cyclase
VLRPVAPMAAICATIFGLPMVALTNWYDGWRERSFDIALGYQERASTHPPVVVVDIDRATLAKFGDWPWSRDKLATLVRAIAERKPRALGIDILLSGPDERSPATLARRLASTTGDTRFQDLTAGLMDGDAHLAEALALAPSVLGLALDSDSQLEEWHGAPILTQGKPSLPAIWHMRGLLGPNTVLVRQAAGLGVLVFPGDADGVTRRAPMLAIAGARIVPGLAVELARLALRAEAILLFERPRLLRLGQREFRLADDAMLRLRPSSADRWSRRTISAVSVLEGNGVQPSLADSIVLVGGSAPELGGLRLAAHAELAPSAQLHADAVEQMVSGDTPYRATPHLVFELLAAAMLTAAAIWIGLHWAPLAGTAVIGAVATSWAVLAMAVSGTTQHLVDPLVVPFSAGLAFAGAALASAANTWRRESLLRARFEQHLAPEVVQRILTEPHLLKLQGELREVTALFTDIEGFTALVERNEPHAVVRALDLYFDGVVQIIVQHGGMVDKIVGDAVYGLFNAPLDLPRHAERAVACAKDLKDFTKGFRTSGQGYRLGFGRTRIGIESGLVIVGDVGGGRKLDYTAYGDAINTAARLEAANKDLGSSICVGPVAQQKLPGDALRPLGRILARGRSEPLNVFEPWPKAYGPADREDYLRVLCMIETDSAGAARALEKLQLRHPDDGVLQRLMVQARATVPTGAPLAGDERQ